MDVKTEPSPADVAEAFRDSTRLNWMEAQGELLIVEEVMAQSIGLSVFEILDVDDEVVGTGDSLRAAIDDAMGTPR